MATPSIKSQTADKPPTGPATVTKPVTKPATVTKPVTKPATVSQPVVKPAPVSQPVAKPAPVTKPVAKPVTKPATVTKPVTKPVSEMPDLAHKSREQLVAGLKQSQQLSVDAVQAWVKGVSGLPLMPVMEAATRYAFVVTADLMSMQRQFALQLTKALPGKKA